MFAVKSKEKRYFLSGMMAYHTPYMKEMMKKDQK